MARLEMTWLEPGHTELAMVLDTDDHREALTAAAANSRIALTATDPADSISTEFPLSRSAPTARHNATASDRNSALYFDGRAM